MLSNDLTRSQMLVMKAVWNLSDQKPSLHVIVEEVNKYSGQEWKSQTVSTFLIQLVRKEYLSMTRVGRLYFYTPLVDRDEYTRNYLKEICGWYDENEKSEEVLKKLFPEL